jgi:hypothetical protein
MNTTNHTAISKESLLAFFNNQQLVSLLSNEDKVEIIAQIFVQESDAFTKNEVKEILYNYPQSFGELIAQRHSPPVF